MQVVQIRVSYQLTLVPDGAQVDMELLRLVSAGVLRSAELITRTIGLAEVPHALATMDRDASGGMASSTPGKSAYLRRVERTATPHRRRPGRALAPVCTRVTMSGCYRL